MLLIIGRRLLGVLGFLEIIVDVLGLLALLLPDPFLKQSLEVWFFTLTLIADIVVFVFVVFFLNTVVTLPGTVTEAHIRGSIGGIIFAAFLAIMGIVLQITNFGLGATFVGWITAGVWILILIGDSAATRAAHTL